jgi:putative DNA primase/helicase
MNGTAERDTEFGERTSGYVSTQADVAAEAHALATQGVRIFPCHPITKRPLVPTGFKAATSDGPTVDAWWRRWPKAMIGMPMGESNGLFALDIDRDAATGLDGFCALASLEEMHGPLPPTRTQRTPRGGEHRLFRWPGVKVRNSASKIGAGIDIRGDGGYIIVPPSMSSTGQAYTRICAAEPAEAPGWLLRLLSEPTAKSKANAVSFGPESKFSKTHDPYVARALTDECTRVAQATSGQRNDALNRAAFSLGQLVAAGTLEREEVEVQLSAAAIASGLVADDGEEAVKCTMRSGLEAGMTQRRELPGRTGTTWERHAVGSSGLDGQQMALLTEDGLALAFARAHQDQLRFCHHAEAWYIWSDTRWRRDEKRLAFNWARQTCRELNRSSLPRLAKAATAAAVERFAQADPAFAVTSETWDADPFLLGTPAGVVDLRTGSLRRARRENYITRQTSVAPDPAIGHPTWDRFLDEVTSGDRRLQRYLRQVAGYCLTGDTREQALFFVYGPGGNGKSVFLNVVMGVMGDYATTSAMDTFTASSGDRHPTDLAMLKGARLVSASETEEGRAWAESRIKQMTGGDTIRARFMRQDFFEYRPQFKLVVVGNHKPVLRNVDEAARRRFNIIPFMHKPQAPDRELEEKLGAEWPAILAWMIGGTTDWLAGGLTRPEVVVEATSEYFSEQDTVQQWMHECCETGDRRFGGTVSALFASWKQYASDNGEPPGSSKSFSQTLQRFGFGSSRKIPGHHSQRGFLGIRLKPLGLSGHVRNRV